MTVYTKKDLLEQISHVNPFYKIETFNDKKVMEESCIIESRYSLISFDSHGLVIHFDALQPSL